MRQSINYACWGSPEPLSWDEGIPEWTRPRQTRVVCVGRDFLGGSATVRYPRGDVDAVRPLTEDPGDRTLRVAASPSLKRDRSLAGWV